VLSINRLLQHRLLHVHLLHLSHRLECCGIRSCQSIFTFLHASMSGGSGRWYSYGLIEVEIVAYDGGDDDGGG
jgi:hypothetical protein